MEREISTERQILSHLRNGEGGGVEVRKYFSRFVMIDDGRPSLLSAHRPSVLPATGGDLRCDPTRSPLLKRRSKGR